jgi:hypothetical protein
MKKDKEYLERVDKYSDDILKNVFRKGENEEISKDDENQIEENCKCNILGFVLLAISSYIVVNLVIHVFTLL